jgi:hypothetical protein
VVVVGNKAIFLGGNRDNRHCFSKIDIYDPNGTEKWIVVERCTELSLSLDWTHYSASVLPIIHLVLSIFVKLCMVISPI